MTFSDVSPVSDIFLVLFVTISWFFLWFMALEYLFMIPWRWVLERRRWTSCITFWMLNFLHFHSQMLLSPWLLGLHVLVSSFVYLRSDPKHTIRTKVQSLLCSVWASLFFVKWPNLLISFSLSIFTCYFRNGSCFRWKVSVHYYTYWLKQFTPFGKNPLNLLSDIYYMLTSAWNTNPLFYLLYAYFFSISSAFTFMPHFQITLLYFVTCLSGGTLLLYRVLHAKSAFLHLDALKCIPLSPVNTLWLPMKWKMLCYQVYSI